MHRPIAVITTTHRGDLERFALLAESMDRRLTGYELHYVIVDDDDLPLFTKFAGPRRTVLPVSRFMPRWLRPAPSFLLRKGRRMWWSFSSPPVPDTRVRQIAKIAAGLRLPEQRFCAIEPSNALIRRFDVGAYAGGARTPLYIAREAIGADSPLHVRWTANCDSLLGLPPTSFPADDYIGNLVVWDKDALRDMAKTIEATTGVEWQLALCRTRTFSEYLLYGHFVRSSPRHRAAHELVPQSLAVAYWSKAPLDRAGLKALLDRAPSSKVSLCVESFSDTPLEAIREAVGLGQPAGAEAPLSRIPQSLPDDAAA
jgi:hypothetical protein